MDRKFLVRRDLLLADPEAATADADTAILSLDAADCTTWNIGTIVSEKDEDDVDRFTKDADGLICLGDLEREECMICIHVNKLEHVYSPPDICE